jgi:hypothetical protein
MEEAFEEEMRVGIVRVCMAFGMAFGWKRMAFCGLQKDGNRFHMATHRCLGKNDINKKAEKSSHLSCHSLSVSLTFKCLYKHPYIHPCHPSHEPQCRSIQAQWEFNSNLISYKSPFQAYSSRIPP